MAKPRLSFSQLFNMNFGFLGIQFGWGLQLANMSAVYERLGARPDAIPALWLAAPLTGLLVQPVIGALSDRTWTRLGRRRPYFLTGAVLASVALFVMPTSSSVLMAASLLWVLDASINVSMEPFRAFVADKLDGPQRTSGFVMQSLFIGVGASLANALPWAFGQLGVAGTTPSGIPLAVKYAFQAGAVVFLLCVLWTVCTTSEDPPADMAAFEAEQRAGGGLGHLVAEVGDAVRAMPSTMKQLAVVQLLTWLGLFCMWLFYVPAVARTVFGATDPQSTRYETGTAWAGLTFAFYSITCFVVALALPRLAARTSRRVVHAGALALGAVGLLSVAVVRHPTLLIASMVGVGVAWASILSMPYAMLSTALPPARMGVYMGVFNFFIVIPEIVASLGFGPLTRALYGADNPSAPLYWVLTGGGFLLAAAAACLLLVREEAEGEVPTGAVVAGDAHAPLVVQGTVQPVPSSGAAERR